MVRPDDSREMAVALASAVHALQEILVAGAKKRPSFGTERRKNPFSTNSTVRWLMYNVLMRFFLTVSSLFFVLLPANGQGWVGAVKVGGAYTSFLGDENIDWGYATGFAAGGAVGYSIDNNFLLQLDITYARMGAAIPTLDLDITGDTDTDDLINNVIDVVLPSRREFNVSYLSFPLLLHYRIDTGGYLHPRVFAGPSVAIKLTESTSRTGLVGGVVDALDGEEDPSLYESIDFGGVVGAGVEIGVGGGVGLFLETRYYLGLRNISVDSASTLRNQGFMLLLGVLF